MQPWVRSESSVLSRVVSDKRTLANTIGFALGHTFGEGAWVATGIDRCELGLAPDRRPGDIDLLVLPEDAGALRFDRAVAIEAKVVRPTFERPDRNANSLGATQAFGLLADGFPFVALLHITVPGPLPAELHLTVPHLSGQLGPDLTPLETGLTSTFDPFPLYSAERQLGRLEALGLPATVACGSIAYTLSHDGERIVGNTIGYERVGERNPAESLPLQQQIAKFVERRPEVFSRVRWYSARAS